MKLGRYVLTLGLALSVFAPAFAQEEPQKEEPAKEGAAAPESPAPPEPAPAEPAKDAPPAPPAVPAPEAPPAAAPAPPAPPAKEMSGCAKSFGALADSYKSAYDDMQKWIGQIDKETSAAGESVQKLQTQIQENEAAATQAKLAKDSGKAKELQKQNKKLWEDFNAAKKAQSEGCAKFVKEAPQRVKQYADATNKALEAAKSQAK